MEPHELHELKKSSSLIRKIELLKKQHLEQISYDWEEFQRTYKVLGKEIRNEDLFNVFDLANTLSKNAQKLMEQKKEAVSMGLLGNLKDFEGAGRVENAPLEIVLRIPLNDGMTFRNFVFLLKPGTLDIASAATPDMHKRLRCVIKRACPSVTVHRYSPFDPFLLMVDMGNDYSKNRKRGDLILERLLKYINKNYTSEATWHEADTYVTTRP